MVLPTTTARVALHSSKKANLKIKDAMKRRLFQLSRHPSKLKERIAALDREWDIERTLEANGSTLLLAGLALGTFVNKKWYLLPAAVGLFCLQHALQGWCPPIEVFRRLGVRTSKEIEKERTALKALRGDFKKASRSHAPVSQVLAAVN